MKYVTVSGIDGSGKTTLIEALRRELERNGCKTHYVWMRYNHILCKPVHAMCRMVGLAQKRQTSYGMIWRHEFYRSPLFCQIYNWLTWWDTWIARLRLKIQLSNKNVDYVICDRWVADILVDLAVEARREDFLETAWYRKYMKLLPYETRQLLIVRKTQHVLECRDENREDPAFSFRQRMYNKLALKNDVYVVDNDGPIEATVKVMLSILE